MNLLDALHAIIDDGIEAARGDYGRPDQRLKLDGSIRGFEECRGKTPVEIGVLLDEARRRTEQARRDRSPDFWYWRCRAAEVEWTANVLSVILLNEGFPVIVPPTYRGAAKAAEILGASQPAP